VWRTSNRTAGWITQWSRSPSQATTIPAQVFNKFRVFYGTQKFTTVFIRVRHRTLFWVRWIQSTPSLPLFFKCVLILPSHLCLDFSSGVFLSGFPIKEFLCISHLPMRATCPVHFTLLYFTTLMMSGEGHKLWSSTLYNFSLGPNINQCVEHKYKCLTVVYAMHMWMGKTN
jgi:hypothetical protein